MKKLLLAGAGLIALSAVASAPAKAEVVYPWCKESSQSTAKNCGFASFAQCRASLSGDVGVCSPNERHYVSRRGVDAYAMADGPYGPYGNPTLGGAALGAGVGALAGGPVGAVIGAGVGAGVGRSSSAVRY